MIFHFPQRKLNYNLKLKIADVNIEQTNEFDFLGLRIQDNLNWNAHLAKIANKLSRIIGVLKRLQQFIPSYALLLIYNSLFLPHLHYGILAWGFSCDRIVKLQKKAIRLICFSNFNAHTEPLFKHLNILKVKDIFTQKALIFYYRYCKNELPGHFSNIFSAIPVTHQYPTRSRDVPRYAISEHPSAQNCVRFFIPKLVNTTPNNITDKLHTHSYTGFSKYIKLHLLNQYSDICTIANCFICNN